MCFYRASSIKLLLRIKLLADRRPTLLFAQFNNCLWSRDLRLWSLGVMFRILIDEVKLLQHHLLELQDFVDFVVDFDLLLVLREFAHHLIVVLVDVINAHTDVFLFFL